MSHKITGLLRNEGWWASFFRWHVGISNFHYPYTLFFCTLLEFPFEHSAIIVHIKSPHYNIYPPHDSQVGGKKGIIIYFRIYFQLHCKWEKQQIYSNSIPRTPYYLSPLLILSPKAANSKKNVKTLRKLAAKTVKNNCI